MSGGGAVVCRVKKRRRLRVAKVKPLVKWEVELGQIQSLSFLTGGRKVLKRNGVESAYLSEKKKKEKFY